MSYGICVCSDCRREVHQGENRTWHHCEDNKPICGIAVYPDSEAEIVGKFCGRDRGPNATNLKDLALVEAAREKQKMIAEFKPNDEGNYVRRKSLRI